MDKELNLMNFRFFILFILLSFCSFAQDSNEKIIWGKPLQWSDFKGKANHNVPYLASANTGLTASFSWKESNGKPKLNYQVYAIFNPYLSWVKPGRESDYLLRHEQLHFDISEVSARQFRKYLEEQRFNPEKISQKVDRKGEQIKKQNRRMQDQYDRQTKHGTQPKLQLKWEEKIHRKLEQLKAYRQNP